LPTLTALAVPFAPTQESTPINAATSGLTKRY